MKELRNGNGAKMLAMMTRQQIFSSACHAHLLVGHTHEDVDSTLALVTTAFGKADSNDFQTPQDMIRILTQSLGPVFHKHRMDFQAEMVDSVSWLVVAGVVLLLFFMFASAADPGLGGNDAN